jgi:uncharacterized protein (DUF1697 family)
MTAFVALLRAVNVGGTGKLAMSDLVKLCERAGFARVKTYIQSGNVVFESDGTEADVRSALARALEKKMKKPVGVLVRRGPELERVLAKNPFPDAATNRVLVFFLPEAPPKKVVSGVTGKDGEVLALHGREIYVHYPSGMGRSKLKVPLSDVGTARNLNTVAKLAEMANALSGAG